MILCPKESPDQAAFNAVLKIKENLNSGSEYAILFELLSLPSLPRIGRESASA
jgi:hypothetical protein